MPPAAQSTPPAARTTPTPARSTPTATQGTHNASPIGATVGSQGRRPLVAASSRDESPEGAAAATRHAGVLLPDISLIVGNLVSMEEFNKFFLKRLPFVMLRLIRDVTANIIFV